jgi:hypothetical protein
MEALKSMRGLILVCLAFVVVTPHLRAQDKLRVLDHPTVIVDALCNAAGSAAGTLSLQNPTTAPSALHLSATDLSSKSPVKHLLIQPVLTAPDTELAAGKEEKVQVAITGLHEDGDWESTIQNDATDLGVLRIIRSTPPFALSLDVATPDAPELTLLRGQTGVFRIKNDDPQEYQVSWEYTVRGETVRSTDAAQAAVAGGSWIARWFSSDKSGQSSQPAAQPASATVTVPPRGQKQVSFVPPARWFGGGFSGLFKDDIADGRLTVSLQPASCAGYVPVSKTFNVKTRLLTSTGAWREGWANLWVFLFLAAGGMFSLGLNSLLPNQMRRIKMKYRLSSVSTRISGLSYDLASRLRVMAGLEQRLITDRLRNLNWTSQDFAGDMQIIDQAMSRLENRLQFLERLSTARGNFNRIGPQVLPPTVIFAIESVFQKIVDIGEKSDIPDQDMQTAISLIKTVEDQLAQGILGNVDFAKDLAARVGKYKIDFDPANGRIGKTDTCKRLRLALPGPFARLDASDATQITSPADQSSMQDFIDLDGRLFELQILRDYTDLVEGLSVTDSLRQKITAHEGELLTRLSRSGCEAAHGARLIVTQMKNVVFKEDIEEPISAARVRIKVDRGEIRRYEPCEFRLEFLRLDLNAACAREEWTCRWYFTLGAETLIEEGWVVTHYFRECQPYTLKIILTHNVDSTELQVPNVQSFPDGQVRPVPERKRQIGQVVSAVAHGHFGDARKEWGKGRRHSGRTLDYIRLAMALVIALFGLIAGAKEQLLKLDLLPALLAVFMVGFGADQIKNLLTQKPPQSDTTAPGTAG